MQITRHLFVGIGLFCVILAMVAIVAPEFTGSIWFWPFASCVGLAGGLLWGTGKKNGSKEGES